MRLTEAFSLAVKNIRGSKMRTFLTMLGIIIGIAAVIVIVGLGNGMQNHIKDSFADIDLAPAGWTHGRRWAGRTTARPRRTRASTRRAARCGPARRS